MSNFISKIVQQVQSVYEKAENFIEEERRFPISQEFLNATLKRYVTDNVSFIKDLHADLHDDWLRLYATIDIAGLYTVLSVDLKLLQMLMNKDQQLIVFEQISQTQVLEAKFEKLWLKWAFYSAIFVYHKILKRDPLGPILQKYDIVEVKDELLHLSLNRWLGKSAAIIDTLNKVNINHATVAEEQLYVYGNVNIAALFNKLEQNTEKTVTSPIENDEIVSE
ncbi:hypothetical protein [Acinetobacter larvae]|uniref:Uncharacterized protein n=1 Tax=Acinetobacter larvae TaxID=1789224 RepID=A0A1B2M2I2_9GAMM|nr:hypothetical protein [Acinetobacter larvae]AOA59394.1 hypothetical protein BFG52_14245 [Acinetobacter larvae]